MPAATAHAAVGGAFVSTLPLWFRANPVAFRTLPLWFRVNSGLFWLAPSWPLRLRAVTAHAVGGPSFRRSRCGFARIPLRFDAPAVVSCEFRCVSMLPLWFRANSGLSWPLQASSGGATYSIGCRPQRRTRWGGPFVSRLPLRFRANSVAFRRSRCGFA